MSSAKIAPVSSKEGDVRVSSKKNKTLTAVVRKKSDTDIGGNLQQTGELVRGQRSWVGSLTALASPRRGYSDGNVPRNVGTSTSMETPALGRKAGRKRVVDVGQKTLRQMNELAKYVNASGPCAICRNPGAVITMTQIRRRRRKLKRQMSKLTEHQRVSSPFLTAVGSPSLDSTRQRRKSVTWIGPPSTSHLPEPGDELHQGTVAIPEPSSGPEVVSQETGAFLLLISVVAFVVGILFMVKSTENSVREYLGMATPLASATAPAIHSEQQGPGTAAELGNRHGRCGRYDSLHGRRTNSGRGCSNHNSAMVSQVPRHRTDRNARCSQEAAPRSVDREPTWLLQQEEAKLPQRHPTTMVQETRRHRPFISADDRRAAGGDTGCSLRRQRLQRRQQ
ncbi:uncharacterized protein LOC135399646 isoform X2 [Ornithodoros turicata]|uniref:uncharacterized protein LOC135399646 isoform X2 n=1 Tax=Ornithodoros turicata TaxID=34597 RepID=UPI003138F593